MGDQAQAFTQRHEGCGQRRREGRRGGGTGCLVLFISAPPCRLAPAQHEEGHQAQAQNVLIVLHRRCSNLSDKQILQGSLSPRDMNAVSLRGRGGGRDWVPVVYVSTSLASPCPLEGQGTGSRPGT